jgi:flagellar basal body-associated protein FliL
MLEAKICPSTSSTISFLYHDNEAKSSSHELCSISLSGIGKIVTVASSPISINNDQEEAREDYNITIVLHQRFDCYLPSRFAALTDEHILIFLEICYSSEQGSFLAAEIARVKLPRATTRIQTNETLQRSDQLSSNKNASVSHSKGLLSFSPDSRFLAVSPVNSQSLYILSRSNEDLHDVHVQPLSLQSNNCESHHDNGEIFAQDVLELSWSQSQCPEVAPSIAKQDLYHSKSIASTSTKITKIVHVRSKSRLVLGALISGVGVMLWRESSFSKTLSFQRIVEVKENIGMGKKNMDDKTKKKKSLMSHNETKEVMKESLDDSINVPISSFIWIKHRIYHNRLHYSWGHNSSASDPVTSVNVPPVPLFSNRYENTDEALYLSSYHSFTSMSSNERNNDDKAQLASSSSSPSLHHHHIVPVPKNPHWSTSLSEETTINTTIVLPLTLSSSASSAEMKTKNTFEQHQPPASQRLNRVRHIFESLQFKLASSLSSSTSSSQLVLLNDHRHLRPLESESKIEVSFDNVFEYYLSSSVQGSDNASSVALFLHRLERNNSQKDSGTVDVIIAKVHIPKKMLISSTDENRHRFLTSVKLLSALVEHVVGAHSLDSNSLDPVPALSSINEDADLEPNEFLDFIRAVTVDLQDDEEEESVGASNLEASKNNAYKASVGSDPSDRISASLRKRTIASLRKSSVFDAAGNACIGEHSGLSLLARTSGRDSIATTRIQLELHFKEDKEVEEGVDKVGDIRNGSFTTTEVCSVTVHWADQSENGFHFFKVHQDEKEKKRKEEEMLDSTSERMNSNGESALHISPSLDEKRASNGSDESSFFDISNSSSSSSSSIDSITLNTFSSLLELAAGGRLDSCERVNDLINELSVESNLPSQQFDESSVDVSKSNFPWRTALWAVNACTLFDNNSSNKNNGRVAEASISLLRALAIPHGSCDLIGIGAANSLILKKEKDTVLHPSSSLDSSYKSHAIANGDDDDKDDDWSVVFADILKDGDEKRENDDNEVRKSTLSSSSSSNTRRHNSQFEKRRRYDEVVSLLKGVEIDAELAADPCGKAALVAVCTALSQRRSWRSILSDEEIDDSDRDKGALSWAGALWALHCPFQEVLLKTILDIVEKFETQSKTIVIGGPSGGSGVNVPIAPSPTVTQECVTWSLLSRLKIPLWLKSDAALASLVDRIARSQFLSSGKNPFACMFSHLCVSPTRISMVRALFRTSSVANPAHQRVLAFLDAYDACKGQSAQLKTQAAKNGYALLQAHRPDHAAAFFLLAGRPGQAVKVTLQGGRKDPLMALAVARLIHASSSSSTTTSSSTNSSKKVDFGSFNVVKLVKDANAMVASASSSQSIDVSSNSNSGNDQFSVARDSQLSSKANEAKKKVIGFGFEDDADRDLIESTREEKLLQSTMSTSTSSSSSSSSISNSSVSDAQGPASFIDPADSDPIAWVLQSEFKVLLVDEGAGVVIYRPFGFARYYPSSTSADQAEKNKRIEEKKSSTTLNACSRIDGVHDAICLRSLLLWLDGKYLLSVALLVRHCSELINISNIPSSSTSHFLNSPFSSQVPALARVLLSRREWKSSTGAVAASFSMLVPLIKKKDDVTFANGVDDVKLPWIEVASSTIGLAAAAVLINNTHSENAISNSTTRRLGLVSLATASLLTKTAILKEDIIDLNVKKMDHDKIVQNELSNSLLNCEDRLMRLFSRDDKEELRSDNRKKENYKDGEKKEIELCKKCLSEDLHIAIYFLQKVFTNTDAWSSKLANLSSYAANEGCWLVSLVLASSSSSLTPSKELLNLTAMRYIDVTTKAATALMGLKEDNATTSKTLQNDKNNNIGMSNVVFDIDKVLAASCLTRLLSSDDFSSIATSLEVISSHLAILSAIRSHEWRKLITLLSLPQVDMKSSGFIFSLHRDHHHLISSASIPGQSLSLLEQWLSAYTGAALHALISISAYSCLREDSKRCIVIPFALSRIIDLTKTWAIRSVTKLATSSIVLETQSSLLYKDAESEAFSWWHHTLKRGEDKAEDKRLLSMRNNGPRAGFINALTGIGFPSNPRGALQQREGQGGNPQASVKSQLEAFTTEPAQEFCLPVELDWEAASLLLDQNNNDDETKGNLDANSNTTAVPTLSLTVMSSTTFSSSSSSSSSSSRKSESQSSSSSTSTMSSRWWWTDTMGLFSFSHSDGVYGGVSSSSSSSSSSSLPVRIHDLHGLCELWDRLGGPGLFWLIGEEQHALQHASNIASPRGLVGLLPSLAPSKSQRNHILHRSSHSNRDAGDRGQGRQGGGRGFDGASGHLPTTNTNTKSVRTLTAVKGMNLSTTTTTSSSLSLLSLSSQNTSCNDHVVFASLLDHDSIPSDVEREGAEHSSNSTTLPPPTGFGSVNSVSISQSEGVLGNEKDQDNHNDNDSSHMKKSNRLQEMAQAAIHAGAVVIERAEASVRPAELDFAAFGGLYDHSYASTMKKTSSSIHNIEKTVEAEFNGTPDRHEYARPFSFPPLCVRSHPTLPLYIRAGPGSTVASIEVVPTQRTSSSSSSIDNVTSDSSFTHRLHNIYSFRELPQPPGGATSPRGTNPAFVQSGCAVSVDWSPDGTRAIAAFAEGVVRVWNDDISHTPEVECTVPLPEKVSYRVQQQQISQQQQQPSSTISGVPQHSSAQNTHPSHGLPTHVYTWSWNITDVKPLSSSGHTLAVSACASVFKTLSSEGVPTSVGEIGSSALSLLQHAFAGGIVNTKQTRPTNSSSVHFGSNSPQRQALDSTFTSSPPPPFSNTLFLFDLRSSVSPLSAHCPCEQKHGLSASGITSLLFDEARSQLVLGGADGSLSIFCLRRLKTISHVPGIPTMMVHASSGDLKGAKVDENKSSNNNDDNSTIVNTFGHLGSVTSLSAHPILGATMIASGSEDGDVRLWSLKDSILSSNLMIPRVHPPALLNGRGGGGGGSRRSGSGGGGGGGVTAMVMLEDQIITGGFEGNIVVSPIIW